MRILRKIISMVLIIAVFSIGVAGPTFAKDADVGSSSDKPSSGSTSDGAFNTGLYPEEKTDKNSKYLFDRYGITNYDLTFIKSSDDVGTDECDDGWLSLNLGCEASIFGYYLAELIWWLYTVLAKWIVSMISWAFSLEVLKYMLNAYTDALDGLQQTLWEPFMYLMWSVAVAWMVYYWVSGKSTRLWSTLLNSLIIIALSVTFMNNLPNFLQTISNASTQTSVFILSGLSDTQKGNPVGTTSADSALNQFKDNLFNFAIVLPYKLVQIGNADLANKKIDKYGDKTFWEAIASKDDGSDRDDVIVDFYDAEKDKDKVKADYSWFTHEKVWHRLGFTVLTFFGAIVALTCFLMIGFYTIMWQLIALGRGLLAAIYLLISLWPEYGMKEAAQWIWSMVQAMFMKVFYTIILAVYINMIIALANNVGKDDGDDIGLLTIWLLALAIFIGLNQALKELRQKLTYIPLGNGMSLQGATNEGEEVGNKTAGAALMAAAAMTGAGGLAAAGMAIKDGGIGGVVSGMTMGAARMVNKGAKIGGKMAKFGGKGLIKAGSKIDDKLFKGRIKKGVESAKGAISRENMRAIRTSGRLSKEDRALMRQAREEDGLDLTTQEGRDAFLEKHPEHAEAIGRLNDRYTSYGMMKKGMPTRIPPKNSDEYKELSKKYGAHNVEAFREARKQHQANRKNLSLKDKVKPPSKGKHAKNISLKETYNKVRESQASTPKFGVTADTVANAKSLPSAAQKVVMDAIKTQIPSNITTDNLDIDWNDIQKQVQDAAKKANTGTGGRGALQNVTVSVNRKDDSGRRTNNKETIKVDLKSLQQSWVSKNPVVANTQLQGQIIQWARGINTTAGGGGRADTSRVVKSFKGHFDMGIQHLASGGKIEDLNFSRLEMLMPELKGLDNMQKLDRVERSIGITPPSGSTEMQRMEMISRALGQNLNAIPTPK